MTSREVAIARKKDLLLAQKQKLLANIKFLDKKIDEGLQDGNNFYENDDSSDSDNGLTVPQNTGPSSRQLSVQQSQLNICLQATQELSRLEVLQSEVDIVGPPQLQQGEEPSEPGLWREVTAECRVDLVPFLITFHFYTPSRKFAPLSYHNLTVKPVKVAHEKELSKSVLSDVITPSDAVQIIRSYAEVHRSRRTTLATLAQKYDGLMMEALEEGGYLLKCCNLLELSWTLVNKWSPIAPFTHRLKFDLEYMDESYIKILRNVHKQLSDPSINTDERTDLLAQFLDVVFEARGANSNIESDSDSVNKTRTTLDQEPEMPETRKKADKNQPIATRNKIAPKNKDSEVMAPPKQLPKKSRGKENVANAQAVNKTSDVTSNVKRNGVKRPLESNDKISKDPIKSKVVENGCGDVAIKKSKPNEVNIDGNNKKGNVDKVKENKQKQSEIASNKNPKQSEANTDKTDKTQKLNKAAVQNKVTKIPTHNKQTKAVSNVEQKTKTVKSDKPVEKVVKEAAKEKTKNAANTENKAAKPNKAKETPVEKILSGNITSSIPTMKITDKPNDMLSKTVPNKPKTTTAKDNTKIANKKSNENLTKVKSTENTTKPTKKDDNAGTKVTKPQQKVADPKISKVVTKIPQKPALIAPGTKAPTSKTIGNRTSSTVAQSSKNLLIKPKMAQNVASKIPQKMTTISEKNQKKFENPLRISPRKQLSTLGKAQQAVSVQQKQAENALRNSPRLLKKPGLAGFKPKSVF